MSSTAQRTGSPWKHLIWAIPVSLALAACEAPRPASYQASHPLVVSREMVSVSIDIPGDGGGLSVRDHERFKRFLRDFIYRGRSPIVVETAALSDHNLARARAEQVRAYLLSRGLRPNEISIIPGGGGEIKETAAILTFAANKVEVPECGDWSADAMINPTNVPHSNYGCSIQRNVGLMMADPGDLVRAQPMGGRDAPSSDRVIPLFRAGKSTASEKSEAQEAGVGE